MKGIEEKERRVGVGESEGEEEKASKDTGDAEGRDYYGFTTQ